MYQGREYTIGEGILRTINLHQDFGQLAFYDHVEYVRTRVSHITLDLEIEHPKEKRISEQAHLPRRRLQARPEAPEVLGDGSTTAGT